MRSTVIVSVLNLVEELRAHLCVQTVQPLRRIPLQGAFALISSKLPEG